MSEENRQQQSSAESTVAGAAKTGKAIASIAKGAATGGAHGAAVEAAKSSKKWIIPIVAVILLPVLIIAMLPSVIFGSLFGDGTDTPNGISDDTVLVQNLADINSGISMILSEGLNDVLARIDSDFAASGCDSILILLAFEPLIRRGMLPSLLREPASAWPWQKWSKRSWLSAVSVIVGAVLP